MIGGTIFPHKGVHKGTWRCPDGVTVNQIDHIAISIKHRAFLQDVKALRGADIGLTAYYLIRAKVRLKMTKVSNTQPLRLYDIKKLDDPNMRENFKVSMEEKYRDASVSALEIVNTLESQWSKWKDSMKQTADTILGYRKGRKEG